MRIQFCERLALRFLSLLKWPLVIFSLYLVFPSSLVDDLSDFIKANSIKKMQVTKDGFSFEVSDEQAIKNIEKAEELNQLAEQLVGVSSQDKSSKEVNKVLEKVKSKTNEIVNSTVSAYAPIQNRDIVIGSVLNSVAEFQYQIKRDDNRGFLLKVFIDKFPYTQKFDLCPVEGNYKFLTKIESNEKSNTAELTYVDKKVNCNSILNISKLKNDEFLFNYDLNFLDGFNIAKVGGFDTLLSKSIKRLKGNSFYISSQDNVIGRKFENGKEVEKEIITITTF